MVWRGAGNRLRLQAGIVAIPGLQASVEYSPYGVFSRRISTGAKGRLRARLGLGHYELRAVGIMGRVDSQGDEQGG